MLQGGHQQVQRLLELRGEGEHLPLVAFLAQILDILSEQRLEKLVFGCGEKNLDENFFENVKQFYYPTSRSALAVSLFFSRKPRVS